MLGLPVALAYFLVMAAGMVGWSAHDYGVLKAAEIKATSQWYYGK